MTHVPLEGGLNLRDLGGYRTAGGREVRRGCVYRSAELCSLTDTDHETLTGLGIAVVFDLRGEAERRSRPSRLPPGVELHERTSASSRTEPPRTLEEMIAARPLPTRTDEDRAATYIRQLDGGLTPELRRILELAVDAPARPLLFHCAAGKDRTGVAAALLLGVLGVPDETIVEDYVLTTTYYGEARLAALGALLVEHGVATDLVLPFLEARAPALELTVRHLHERWGGYDAYVVAGLGLPADFPALLRASLLTG